MNDYLKRRQDHIFDGRPLPEKKIYKMKAVSDKLAAKKKEQKASLGEDDPQKEKWFKARQREMIGVCQCGCGQESQKNDKLYFRHSAAHIFPKKIFESIQYHRLNWVERRFWGGCHATMDNKSMDLWPNMADWEDIKEKFYQLAPLLTEEERKHKFYKHLEKLVYG